MTQNQLDMSLPMNDDDVFHFDDTRPNFNGLCKQNGITYWLASDLMTSLGYQTMASFSKAVQKAIAACASLNIDVLENFQQCETIIDGVATKDYKLTRFACYMVTLNADSKKPEVARAQAYFAVLAETFKRYIEQADDVERILIRDEISKHEKSLGAAATKAGVTEYQYFQSAGYRGLYNMNMGDLKRFKGLSDTKRSLLDFMGKEELAANLFRVTQTEAKLINDNVRGQKAAEQIAENVGRKVREAMIDISGNKPEDLPLTADIKDVRSAIKSSKREFDKLDKPRKNK